MTERTRHLVLVIICSCAISAGAQEPEQADSLGATYGELDELVITARKEVVKSDGAKLTYDMEQDETSKGQNLLEALRKIPMVTVDGQDNIYIKGSQNFRVYVNGKEDPMLTANYQQVFKAMPAESVSKIEVITEPGAKYDSEGTGGILNLITERKQSKDGYAGSASISAGSQSFGASLYGRMKYDKVTADANVNYMNSSLQKNYSESNQEVINEASDDNYRQFSTNTQRFYFNYVGANLNLSWEPTERDLWTAGADINWVKGGIDDFILHNYQYTRNGNLLWHTKQDAGGGLSNIGTSANTSYRRLFDDNGHSLTAAYRFNYGRSMLNLDYHNMLEAGDLPVTPYEKNDNGSYQREHTATIDYVNPFGSGNHTLEAGAKGVFRRNSSETGHETGETVEGLLPDTGEEGAIKQIQDVYAAYLSYTGKFGKFSVTAGLRYEHTYMGLDFTDSNYENFRRNLDDVTPNASVTYMFGPTTNLRLAYQMRINRPQVSQMNPAVFQITQTFAQIGNPDLESERYNNVSLSYSNWGRVVGGTITLTYGQANNTIEDYSYTEDGINYSTYGNFGKNRHTELSAYFNWNINQRMTVSINGGVNYTDIRSNSKGLGNQGWKGNYGLNWSYRGPWDIKYSAYGGQSFGNIKLQGESSGWKYYGLAISKSFLKEDALTVSINASNFFTKMMTFKDTTINGSYTYHSEWRNRSWNVGINISWKFGHLKDQVKKTDANLDTDDAKKSDGKGGGIGI